MKVLCKIYIFSTEYVILLMIVMHNGSAFGFAASAIFLSKGT